MHFSSMMKNVSILSISEGIQAVLTEAEVDDAAAAAPSSPSSAASSHSATADWYSARNAGKRPSHSRHIIVPIVSRRDTTESAPTGGLRKIATGRGTPYGKGASLISGNDTEVSERNAAMRSLLTSATSYLMPPRIALATGKAAAWGPKSKLSPKPVGMLDTLGTLKNEWMDPGGEPGATTLKLKIDGGEDATMLPANPAPGLAGPAPAPWALLR